MTEKIHFIANQWIAGEGQPLVSFNPSNNTVIWQGLSASAQQVDAAVMSARQHQQSWFTCGVEQRIAIVKRYKDLLNAKKEQLAYAIGEETGKPLWESRTEIGAMAAKIDISIQAYHERTGEKSSAMPVGEAKLKHKPHGVVAIYGPYNFPGHLPNGHIIPALIAGNTIIFKPSDLTPRFGQLMVELWQEAGIPDGVLNLVQGAVEVGQILAAHPQIDGLFFTGSSATGHKIHQQFAGQPHKILALEMGGNNPLIVTEVANSKAAIHDIIQSAFITSGQRCTCARRLIIPDTSFGYHLINQLVDTTKALKIDNFSASDQPFMGSLISKQAAKQIIAAQTKLINLGAKPLLTAQQLDPELGFVTPGILDCTMTKDLPDEEYFGPLLKVYRYKNFEQAIDLANDTQFGLSAGLFSDQREEYEQLWQASRAGIVNWNRPITGASSNAPFGGIGASGNHRASAYYAADYCAYPVASVESETLVLPKELSPGLTLE